MVHFNKIEDEQRHSSSPIGILLAEVSSAVFMCFYEIGLKSIRGSCWISNHTMRNPLTRTLFSEKIQSNYIELSMFYHYEQD